MKMNNIFVECRPSVFHQVLHQQLGFRILLSPPPHEEGHLHVGKGAPWVSSQAADHGVQDHVHVGMPWTDNMTR